MTVEKLRYRLNFYKMYGGNVTITWDMNTYINGNGHSKYKSTWKHNDRSQ